MDSFSDSKKFSIIMAALTLAFCVLSVVYNFASVPAYGEETAQAVPVYLPTAVSSQLNSGFAEKSSQQIKTSSLAQESSVLSESEVSAVSPLSESSQTAQETEYPVNLNRADQKTLETVPYIGEVHAKAIIDYRNANGPFKSIDDLDNVKGFGKTTIDKIREYLTV